MAGEIESGKCDYCGKEGPINRKYFHYPIKCECHSPQHFELVFHCNDCFPIEPETTKLVVKTEILKLKFYEEQKDENKS